MSVGNLRPFGREHLSASVVRRFEDVVASAPDRIAVRTDAGELSYDALNRAANSVAHALSAVDRGEQRPIALLFGHSHAGIGALLGVMKAGAFYVPLDPAHPIDRLRHVVDDCQPSMIVTDVEYLGLARKLAARRCPVRTLQELHHSSDSSGNPCMASDATDPAALFYTSGSTGRPKGVLQTHRLILHRVLVDTNRLRVRPDDRLSLLSPPTYSVSLRHLFGALLNGAMVCPFNVAEDGVAAVPGWIARDGITVYFSVPSVFREWMRLLDRRSDVRTVRVVHIGGDTVTSDDFARYQQWFSSDCVFVNSFASNEAGIVRYYRAEKWTEVAPGPLPVGHEVEDKEVLVLGEDGRALDTGAVGRIAVRSEFLSPGYWQQPALTDAAFRTDADDPSKRVYCTGDLGVLRADGSLWFMGRVESRAKIRGVTVAVEEVEAAITSHPAVEQAVVTVAHGDASESRLTAYVVAATPLTVTALRTYLRRTLPACMVPASYVFLDTLPTTPHGKVDRAHLPAPSGARPQLATTFCAPRDGVETQIAAICEEITGVRPIGAEDDLFDLGLDSLGALVVAAEIEKQIRRPLRPGLLFAAPSIRQLACALDEGRLTRLRSLVPVQTEGSMPPFFWIHGDSGTRPLSRVLGPEQPLYLLDHQAQDGRPAECTEVKTIASLYLSEIRTVQSSGPYFVGGYSFGGVVALEIAQQLADRGEQVALLAVVDPPSLVLRRASHGGSGSSASAPSRRASAAVARHLRSLARLRPREYWSYIAPRVTDRLGPIVPAVRLQCIRSTYRACVRAGRRLPAFTRKRYIFDVYDRARVRYAPKPYDGPALLFKGVSRIYADASDWEQILGPACAVRILHATHREMRSSHVQLWAGTLSEALVSAQARVLDCQARIAG